MKYLFHLILTQPLFNALVFLYQTAAFQDFGVAIILLTLVIRIILYPLFYKSYKNQTLLQMIQPEIKKIQHTHKDSKEKQAEALLALYKQHKVNPFSGFFLLFIQLPILIALYRVFLNGFSKSALTGLYGFISAPATLNNMFLGLIDLKKPNILIIGLAVLAQYFQGRLSQPQQAKNVVAAGAQVMAKQMVYIAPVLTLFVLYSLPSAVGIYWLVTSVFSVIQQILINKSLAAGSIIQNGESSGTSPKNT